MSSAPSKVVMMCGPAGSGKTTFARQLDAQGFIRLSIDEEVGRRMALGELTPKSDIPQVSVSIEEDLRNRLIDLVHRGEDVVVDFSFWRRSARDAYRHIIEENGGTAELVYIRVPSQELHARTGECEGREDANSVHIDSVTLDRYISDFEAPGEDEHPIVIDSMPGGMG